jgi:hypothetical protein
MNNDYCVIDYDVKIQKKETIKTKINRFYTENKINNYLTPVNELISVDLLYKYFPVILDKGIKCNLSEIRNGNVKLRDSISRTNTRIIESKKLEIPLIKIKIKLRDIKNLCIVGWCSIDFVIEDEYIIFNIPK